MEQWKQIKGYEGYYEISNYGNVRSIDRTIDSGQGRMTNLKGRVLKQTQGNNGYKKVRLSKNGKSSIFSIHRLVAIYFIPNPENKPVVNHKDYDRHNNNSDNLEWSTQKENIAHADERVDKVSRIKAIKKANTKITPEEKDWIRENYIAFDSEFGAIALAKKFGVTNVYISIIANSKKSLYSI